MQRLSSVCYSYEWHNSSAVFKARGCRLTVHKYCPVGISNNSVTCVDFRLSRDFPLRNTWLEPNGVKPGVYVTYTVHLRFASGYVIDTIIFHEWWLLLAKNHWFPWCFCQSIGKHIQQYLCQSCRVLLHLAPKDTRVQWWKSVSLKWEPILNPLARTGETVIYNAVTHFGTLLDVPYKTCKTEASRIRNYFPPLSNLRFRILWHGGFNWIASVT